MPAQESGGSITSNTGAMGANKPGDSEERDRTDRRRKTDEEHPEDPEGKWMRSKGPKRKSEDEDEREREQAGEHFEVFEEAMH